MLLGKFAEAESALRRATELAPKQRSGWNNLGIALGRQEHSNQALVAFREGRNEQGARNNLGYVYFLNGRFDEAIDEYEAALLEGGRATPMVVENLDRALEARDDSR
jgi:Flp pilus assembly protein TadD